MPVKNSETAPCSKVFPILYICCLVYEISFESNLETSDQKLCG